VTGLFSGAIILPVQDGNRERFGYPSPDAASRAARLSVLAADEIDRQAIEADFAGWDARVIDYGGRARWEAEDKAGGALVWADDARRLRTALAEFGA
jgi:hypothetical protein